MTAPFPAAIDQRRLPGLSPLFRDYLYDFARVAPFFGGGAPFVPDALSAAARRVVYPEDRRRAAVQALRRQAQRFGAQPGTLAQIDLLAQPGTVAVVTGQQVGLFGGPLLGLYKTMTAIRLAERLRADGIAAVPIFWMASQDHDLAEVDHTTVLDLQGQPRRIAVEVAAPARALVGPIAFNAAIEPALAAWSEASGIPAEASGLAEAYAAGATFASAFARLWLRWFAPWGLIVFDPLDADELQAAAAPLYAAAVERQPEIFAALAQRGQELDARGYHQQVHAGAHATMLFEHRQGIRAGVRRDGRRVWIGDEEEDLATFARRLQSSPAGFSPAALLRPLLQDRWFPAAIHVTGPAETAYLAQSSLLYSLLGQVEPLRFPRASATLLDPRTRRLLEKYSLSLETVWSGDLAAELARRELPAELEAKLARLRADWQNGAQALAEELRQLDPTLIDAAATAGAKVQHQLEQLEARIARSLARRRDDLDRHAQILTGMIAPQRSLQERLHGAAGWMGRQRERLLEQLHGALAELGPDHRIIEVE